MLINSIEKAANKYNEADNNLKNLATDSIVNKTESGAKYESVNEYLNAAITP